MFALGIKLLNLVVIWVIQRYTKLLTCFLDTLISGSVGAVAQYAGTIRAFLNDQLSRIQQALKDGLNGLTQALNGGAGAVNDIAGFFSGGQASPLPLPVTLPGVEQSLNFQIPEAFVNDMQNLAKNVPSFVELENRVLDKISGPFVVLQEKIKANFNGINISSAINGNSTFSAVPKTTDLAICNGRSLNLGWIDQLAQKSSISLKIFGAALIATIIAYVLFKMYITWKHHKGRLNQIHDMHIASIEEAITSPMRCDELARSHQIADLWSSPTKARIVQFFAPGSLSSRVRTRWYLDFVLHTPSILCLLFGITGLVFISVQTAILNGVVAKFTSSTEIQSVHAISSVINGTIRPIMDMVSADITSTEERINSALFGTIKESISLLNETVTTVSTGFNDALQAPFANIPVLKDVVGKFVLCLIGSKLEKLEDLAEMVQNMTKISLPRLDPSLFTPSDQELEKLISPVSGFVKGQANAFFDEYRRSLASQYLEYVTLTAFGSFIFLLGLLGLLYVFVKEKQN